MVCSLKTSIDRAIRLLETPAIYENYISIKLSPVPRKCCCFHCWPTTWSSVNTYIVPYGPIEDEGDVIIGQDNARFILECHESGPEIVVYLGLATASFILVKSVVDMITTILKSFQRKNPAQLKIMKRRLIRGEEKHEVLMEVNIPISEEVIKKLNAEIEKALAKTPEN